MRRELIGPGGLAFAVHDGNVSRGVGRRNGHKTIRPSVPSVTLLPGNAYTPEPIRWLWKDWLALGKLHLLAGSPGTGKTSIGITLAAAITSGGQWPDGTPIGQPGSVIVWSGEDGVSDTLLPRFLAAAGNPARIHFVEGVTGGGDRRAFDPSTDMPRLAGAVKEVGDVRLLLLDPVVSAIATDSHKNGEVRRGLQPVVDLADRIGCAALGISHLSKNTSGREPLERVAGSIAFGAVSRVVWATVRPADQEAPRRLVRVKSNVGPDSGGVAYQLLGAPVPGHDFNAQVVEWGEILEGTARELMAVELPEEEGGRDDAEVFLLEALREGPVATKEIRAAATAHGHAWRTVNRAKQDMGIKAVKLGMRDGWAWQLPDPPKNATREAEECHSI